MLGWLYGLFRRQRDRWHLPILVVDDDPGVIRATCAVLRRHGYLTVTAADGEEAWAVLQMHSIGLVILDQRMAGVAGTGLYPAIEVPTLVVSGAELEIDLRSGDRYLMKPWIAEDFLAVVEEMIGRPPPA